ADGTVIDIEETVTTLTPDATDPTQLVYTSEDGTTTTIDTNGVSVADQNDGNTVAQVTEADGTVIDIEETVTTLTPDATDPTQLVYTSEDGTTTTIDTTDDQMISTTVTTPLEEVNVALEDGGDIDINIQDADADPTNEIQTLSISGNDLTISDGNTVTLPEPTLTVTKETIGYVFAAAHTQANGTNSFNINSTVTRTAVGRYTVAFTTAHPNGASYDVTFGAQEDITNRDTRLVSVVTGTQTANGFQVMVATGDNGGTADVLVDEVWYFNTSATREVVTDVVLVTSSGSNPVTNPTTPSGTPTTDFTQNNFADAQNFSLNFNAGNNAGSTWEALISNRPYAALPTLTAVSNGSPIGITVVSQDNGDGTYNYLITGTDPLAANNPSITISGGTTGGGTGTQFGGNCTCVTFYIN
ncbi:hypothetical protein Q4512_15910, partial [Oceanihabitans sp. 2_MG-2023]|uniref:hypothetical protein n=1 Tax=Oceanihabitans sp. 2_MG-2023 TaxID=3062661 RepID=UPI0026E242BC